jgi:hypothetical protein
MRGKRLIFLSGGVGLILLAAFWIFWILGDQKLAKDDVIATVNGEPITALEFEHRMQRHRGQVQSYFFKTYGAKDSANFWTTEYDGNIPIEMVKSRTFEELTRIKIQQWMAKERGIVSDISYDGLLRQMKEENRKRKQAAGKSAIFGPISFDEHTFFEYSFSNMVIALKRKLADEGLLSDRGDFASLNREYEQWIDQELKKAEIVVHDSVYKRVTVK